MLSMTEPGLTEFVFIRLSTRETKTKKLYTAAELESSIDG